MRVKIGNANGIEAIRSAMENHQNNAKVQEYGCAAFQGLALNDAMRVKIGNANGIEAIRSAMENHQNNAKVQKCGYAAFLNLARNDAMRVKIVNTMVQLYGRNALEKLAL